MTPIEAAEIVEVMSRALRANPGQFQINISAKAVGFSSVSHGGIGTQVSVGGSGNTGIRASASTGDVQIAITAAQQQMSAELEHLCQTLEQVTAELRRTNPDVGTVRALVRSIAAWVPTVISGVLSSVIAHGLTG